MINEQFDTDVLVPEFSDSSILNNYATKIDDIIGNSIEWDFFDLLIFWAFS
jgi:hypothetical protein